MEKNSAQTLLRYLGVKEAAAYASLSTRSIRRMLAAGRLTALRPVRGRIVIDRTQLDSVILNATAQPRHGRGLSR